MRIKPEILNKSGYALFIILVILLSFRIFSTIYYPKVNSDEAIVVLMLHDFHLPGDLYFWGQDRYGSLVPLLGQVPFKFFGLSSLLSESLIHFLILIAGFMALAGFIRSKTNKVLFALAWFLPAVYYTDLLRNVFGLQYSMTGILLFFISKYEDNFPDQFKGYSEKLPYFILLLIIMTIAFWVSDLSISTVSAFILVSAVFLYKKGSYRGIFKRPESYLFIVGLIIVYLLIKWLKSLVEVGPYDNYSSKLLNDFPGILRSITLLITSIGSILAFQVRDFLFSIYSYLLVINIILILVFRKNIIHDRRESRWAAVFILDGILLAGIVMASNWALVNEVPRRYFVGVHISFWLAYLIFLSNFIPGRTKKILTALTACTLLTGSLSTIYIFRFVNPGSFKSKAAIVSEFSKNGETGIIADYWNAYSSAFADPDRIKATPYELSYAVRNFKLIDSVFARPRIVLIRDMWMEDFPDSLVQFDRTLLRKSSPYLMGGCQCCDYSVKNAWNFGIHDLKHIDGFTGFDNSINKEVLKIGEGYRDCIYKHVVFGPFMTLLEGRYEVSFSIRFDSVFTKTDMAELDVVSDYGQHKFASRVLSPSMITSSKDFHEYKLEFEIEEKDPTIEFRIYYLGGAYLTFEKIKVQKVVY